MFRAFFRESESSHQEALVEEIFNNNEPAVNLLMPHPKPESGRLVGLEFEIGGQSRQMLQDSVNSCGSVRDWKVKSDGSIPAAANTGVAAGNYTRCNRQCFPGCDCQERWSTPERIATRREAFVATALRDREFFFARYEAEITYYAEWKTRLEADPGGLLPEDLEEVIALLGEATDKFQELISRLPPVEEEAIRASYVDPAYSGCECRGNWRCNCDPKFYEGGELVSPPGKTEGFFEKAKQIMDKIFENGGWPVYYSGTATGYHVHVDARDMSQAQTSCLAWLGQKFVSHCWKEKLFPTVLPAWRENFQYCKNLKTPHATRTIKECHDQFRYDGRYVTCNLDALSKFGTVELRVGYLSKDTDEMIEWAKTWRMIADWVAEQNINPNACMLKWGEDNFPKLLDHLSPFVGMEKVLPSEAETKKGKVLKYKPLWQQKLAHVNYQYENVHGRSSAVTPRVLLRRFRPQPVPAGV